MLVALGEGFTGNTYEGTDTLVAAWNVKSMLLQAVILGSICVESATPVFSQIQNRAVQTARTASIHWNQVPLAEGLQRISLTYGAPIRLDRRVDSSGRITLDTQDAGLVETLKRTASAAGLGVSHVGGLHYVGPASTVDNLRTLAALRSDEVAQLPAASRPALIEKRPLSWQHLTQPRELVAAAVTQRGWRIAGEELMPHDLWTEGRLPAMTLADQLTVLLAGFDLTFRLTAGNKIIEIVPIADPLVLINRRYRLRYGASDAERLRRQFPSMQIQSDGEWASVDGRIEDHERLAEWLAGPQSRPVARPPTGSGKQVYSLRIKEQPVRAVVQALIQRLNWPLEADEEAIAAAGLSLDRRVTFEVKDASQEELLRAMLTPAGLDFRRQGERIKIEPRK